MKKQSIQLIGTLIILLLSTFILVAQAPDTLWTKSIGENVTQIAYSVYPTDDGGFMIGGYTSGTGSGDYYMVKTDSEGEVILTKTFGQDDRYESSNCMIETTDGGYILAGGRAQDEPYSSKTDVYLIKTDSNGEEQWTSIIGFEDISETPNCIVQTSDGGYIVCGSYWASSQTVFDIFLIKTNNLGLQEWRQVLNFEDGKAEHAAGIEQDDDGGYLVTGKTQAFATNYDYNAYILKTNNTGELVWLKTYGGDWPWYEQANHIIKTSDDGFMICGNQDNDGIDKNWFVVKTDNLGNELWSNNSIGGTYHDGAFYSCETTDGNYVVTGNYHQDVWKPFITKFDINGDTLWTKMWGTGDDNSQYNYAIKQLDDGGFITAGSTTTDDGHNIYLSRLSPETVGINDPENLSVKNQVELFQNNPNPFNSKTIITYKLNQPRFVNVSIFNVYGQKVIVLIDSYQSSGKHEVEFNCEKYKTGIYYCILSSGDEILTRKLIKSY